MKKKEPMHERRSAPRADTNIVIRYRVLEEVDNYDLSQSKNLSLRGTLLFTNRHFPAGTRLAMTTYFPFLDKEVDIVGEVVDSQAVVEGMVYKTHVQFNNRTTSCSISWAIMWMIWYHSATGPIIPICNKNSLDAYPET